MVERGSLERRRPCGVGVHRQFNPPARCPRCRVPLLPCCPCSVVLDRARLTACRSRARALLLAAWRRDCARWHGRCSPTQATASHRASRRQRRSRRSRRHPTSRRCVHSRSRRRCSGRARRRRSRRGRGRRQRRARARARAGPSSPMGNSCECVLWAPTTRAVSRRLLRGPAAVHNQG